MVKRVVPIHSTVASDLAIRAGANSRLKLSLVVGIKGRPADCSIDTRRKPTIGEAATGVGGWCHAIA